MDLFLMIILPILTLPLLWYLLYKRDIRERKKVFLIISGVSLVSIAPAYIFLASKPLVIALIALLSLMIFQAYLDVTTLLLSDLLTLILAVTGAELLAMYGICGTSTIKEIIITVAISVGIMLMGALLSLVFKLIGFGDIKLMAAVALLFGPSIVTVLFIASLASVIYATVRNIIKRKWNRTIAFGPFIILAMYVFIILGR